MTTPRKARGRTEGVDPRKLREAYHAGLVVFRALEACGVRLTVEDERTRAEMRRRLGGVVVDFRRRVRL